jgi:hypothetical protein
MFGVHYKDLKTKENKTSQEEQFISWAEKKNPLDMSPSVVNKICWAIEDEFDSMNFSNRDKFDCSMIKSGVNYSKSQYCTIESLHKWYKKQMSELTKKHKSEYYHEDVDNLDSKEQIVNYFKEQCELTCPNKYELCDILIDMCYKGRSDKEIVWLICGETIVENLLKNNNYNLYYPSKVKYNEEFECCGAKFVMKKLKAQGGEEE